MNVSVLICTFGSDEWRDLAAGRAYESALRQSARVSLRHLPEGTLAEARNEAAREALGDWLCFLDADDELCPGYLEAMEHTGTQHWYEPPCLLAPAVSYDGSSPAIPNRGGWPSVNECVIGTLVPRKLFLEVGGFREKTDGGTPITIYEDWDAFLRMSDAGARIVHVPEAVYCAHSSDGSRNTGADWKPVYDAIWRDHEARLAVKA